MSLNKQVSLHGYENRRKILDTLDEGDRDSYFYTGTQIKFAQNQARSYTCPT